MVFSPDGAEEIEGQNAKKCHSNEAQNVELSTLWPAAGRLTLVAWGDPLPQTGS